MSAKKQIVIVCMVSIVTAICMIFAVFSGNEAASQNRIREAEKYLENMDYDNAIAIYNDILRTNEQSTNAYLGLAEAYLKKGNESKAIEILEKGLDYAGNNRKFYSMLSELTGKEYYYADAGDDLPDQNMTGNEETFPDLQQPEEITGIYDPEMSIPEASETEPPAAETSAPEVTAEQTAAGTEGTGPVPAVQVQETTTAAPQTLPAVSETAADTTAIPTVEVPNFTGKDKDYAVRLAEALNIDLKLEYNENKQYENDIIYYQDQKAGTQIPEQTSITVYVSVNNQPTEEELNVQAFFNAAREWGELNSSQVKSVTFNENGSVVAVSLSSIKKFTVDSSVMEAFAECNNAVMVINSSVVSITIKSSSVTKTGKLNLSADVYGNDTRTAISIGTSGSLNCTASVTVLDCDINPDELENMNLYYNNKKVGKISVNSDGNPVMTISSGGQYLIR